MSYLSITLDMSLRILSQIEIFCEAVPKAAEVTLYHAVLGVLMFISCVVRTFLRCAPPITMMDVSFTATSEVS